MVLEKEGTFRIGDKELYTKSWLPDGLTKAKLVFIHGFSDHVNRYYGFFPFLAERGIAVHGFDQRGWGRSVAKPAEKGLTGPTTRVLDDMAAFIRPHLPSYPSDPPVFVMGHSMGGGQVLTLMSDPAYAKDIVSRVRGFLLEAPFIDFAPEERPWTLKVIAGRLASHVLPRFHLSNRIPPENLSRDPEVVRSLDADPLVHDTGTLEGLAGLLDRTAALASGSIRPPSDAVRAIWVGHGTADKATSFSATKKWFDQCATDISDRTFKAYEGYYHQLHADKGREEFYEDVAAWILERAEPTAIAPLDAKL
ncbi:hypothetical protein VTK73DRAFT_7400 [Phialemonium thermophilum]|uniref:Serine aminopeptidase S33 domain-containing protein n=1 Tax=Phialemonium thermophilum TaxID=223376 RepID=A0ABR3XTL8_9PEZI